MRPLPVSAARRPCLAPLRCAALLVLGAALFPFAAAAQELDPAVFDAAVRLYSSVAGCAFCHGWHGEHGELYDLDSGVLHDPGPSLVASTLDRAAMIEVVACGVPDSRMPRYLAEAWTEQRPCYGMLAGGLEGAELPPRDEALLSLRQIEGVVDFVQAVYQGTGMSKESCYRYYTLTHPMCDRLEEAGGQRQQPARIR